MITAEEARKRTEEYRKKIEEAYEIDLDSTFSDIDSTIEDFIQGGKNGVILKVLCAEESLDCIHYKRRKIIERYSELGYNIESIGYSKKDEADWLKINW